MTLLLRNSNNREEIKEAVSSLKPEIQKIFGAELQTKVVNLLHNNFDAINDMIETKFNEMRESHQKDKDDIIQAIQNERANIAAKDAQNIKLMLKEGELKGKDEVIATLNHNIEKLQQ